MIDYEKYSKMFAALEDLSKADMSLSEALKLARKSNPDVANVLARHIYTDTLVPRVGNKFAYNDFLSRHGKSGVHISLDGNSFGSINKEFSHEHGDEAIKQMFNTISDVSRKYGLKAFRTGGDEGKLHASSPERAHAFAKELQEIMAKLPPVKGTNHKLSVSVGIGFSPEHAEKALTHAKDQLGPLVEGKRKKYNLPGNEQTVYHSLLHESPPAGWTPTSGKVPPVPHEGVETEAFTTPGLKYSNPLKKTDTDDEVKKYYTSEGCPHFAIAMHRRFGHPIKMLIDDDDDTIAHVYNVDKQTGHVLDVMGRRTEQDLKNHWFDLSSPRTITVGSEHHLKRFMGEDNPLHEHNESEITEAMPHVERIHGTS